MDEELVMLFVWGWVGLIVLLMLASALSHIGDKKWRK